MPPVARKTRQTAPPSSSAEESSQEEQFIEQEEQESSEQEVLADLAEEEQEDLSVWGKNKKNYYTKGGDSADEASGSDAELLASTSIAMQQKQAASLRDEDFSVEHFAVQTAAIEEIEKIEKLSKAAPEFVGLLQQFSASLSALNGRFHAPDDDLQAEGVSFFAAKNNLLTTYCLNILYFCQLKLKGVATEGHPVIEHLIRLRLLLEKIAPIEAKLKYQVDKLLRAAETVDANMEQEIAITQYKANIAAFLPAEEQEEVSVGGKYVAPRLQPVAYDGSKKKREDAGMKESVAKQGILRELRAEYSEMPEEESLSLLTNQEDEKAQVEQRITAFEEDNFTRFSLPGKKMRFEAARKKKLTNEMADLEKFVSSSSSKGGKASKKKVSKGSSKKKSSK